RPCGNSLQGGCGRRRRRAAGNPVDRRRSDRPEAPRPQGRSGLRGGGSAPTGGGSTIQADPWRGESMAVAEQSFQQLSTAGLDRIDPEIAELLGRETERQRGQVELIASE